jgi:adhesin transport system membrane fusion protein
MTQERRLASLNTNFQADAETRLIETRMLAAQTEARLDALEGKVQQTEVKSPVHGTVSAVHFSTIGGVVDAGAVLAEIVPIEEEGHYRGTSHDAGCGGYLSRIASADIVIGI